MRTRRAVLPAIALAGLTVLAVAGPAAGHGDSINFAVTTLGDGHPRAVASWANDGDALTEPVAGTLSATASDGRTVGPWRLVAVQGKDATYTTEQALPPGSWKVTVDAGFPALGHAETQLNVNAVPAEAPSAGPSVATSVAPSVAPVAAPAPAHPASATNYWLPATGAVLALGVLGAVLYALRRKRA